MTKIVRVGQPHTYHLFARSTGATFGDGDAAPIRGSSRKRQAGVITESD